ncbi:MAG: N-acetylneuraminate synthase [Lachnospiraceae bacterium]|nr:N-acetylneuraminate synthase [Lachnospiraceae bacterium]
MGKVLIIAEAGVNHNGDIKLAKKLALVAKECGADIVKFQTANLASFVSEHAGMARYQKENIGKETSQREMLEKLLLSYDEFSVLASYCSKIGIQFLSTPFDIKSVKFLQQFGCPFWKIPSGEVTNFPYLIEIAKTHKPVIMSTGMCTMNEIEEAILVLESYGSGNITLLHCTTEYPAPFGHVNLKAMSLLHNKFLKPVGYSDHTLGIEVPIAAVAIGGVVIEKHFTLDREMEGPDHKASLEPHELKQMVKSIHNIEKAMGDGIKQPYPEEFENRIVARKSIVAKKDICKGEIFTEHNITTKRPGNGISPMEWFNVIGKCAKKDFKEDEMVEL